MTRKFPSRPSRQPSRARRAVDAHAPAIPRTSPGDTAEAQQQEETQETQEARVTCVYCNIERPVAKMHRLGDRAMCERCAIDLLRPDTFNGVYLSQGRGPLHEIPWNGRITALFQDDVAPDGSVVAQAQHDLETEEISEARQLWSGWRRPGVQSWLETRRTGHDAGTDAGTDEPSASGASGEPGE